MSLETLFEDRKRRKYIRDSINEAREMGLGNCSNCGSKGYLVRVFEEKLCDVCCESILDIVNDYDVTVEDLSESKIMSSINEDYFIPDMAKVQADANSKFNGSIPDLMRSYNLYVPSDWDDRISKGWLWADDNDMKSGKTKLNKFLNDYNCVPVRKTFMQKLVPDSDGTTFSYSGSTAGISNTVGNATKQSSSQSVSSVPSVSTNNGYVSGNIDNFEVQLGDNEEISVVKTQEANGTKTFEVSYDKNKISIILQDSECSDMKSAVESIKKKIIENPGLIFPAFEETGSLKRFSISKYPFYEFVLDDDSFGKKLSLAIVYNGKVYNKNSSSGRVFVAGKSLSNKMIMSSELTKSIDERIAKVMPSYISNNKFKTSIGTAIFDLVGVDDGIAEFEIDLANTKFSGKIDQKNFSNDKDAKDAYADMILNAIYHGLIPEFTDNNLKCKRGNGFELEIDGKKVSTSSVGSQGLNVYAEMDDGKFYDSGDIVFNISVLDKFSGNEYPKELKPYVYRKVGTKLSDFLEKCAMDIFDDFIKTSNTDSKMRGSAVDKMRSPSKKFALLRRISDTIKRKLISSEGILEFNDLELELDMKVNNKGEATDAIITVYDEYRDIADSSDELKNKLGLERKIKWLKFKEIDKKEKEGPKVIYTVSDINEFSNYIDISVFESLIFEAFGIVQISESGRKKFYV